MPLKETSYLTDSLSLADSPLLATTIHQIILRDIFNRLSNSPLP
jgi:hypothetical protein